MKAGKALTRTFITNQLTILIVSIILPISVAFIAFERNAKGQGRGHQSEKAEKAEEYFQEALNLSGADDPRLARERLSQAVHLWVEIREFEKAARASLQVGEYYRLAKKFLDSLFYYRQALDIKPLSAETKALAFNAIAKTYGELYLGDLAEYYFKKAVDQARDANNISLQTEVLSELATLYYQMKEKQKTLDCITQVQRLIKMRAKDNAEAAILFLTGKINQEQGRMQSSRDALEKSLAIYQKIGNKAKQVMALCAISDLNRSSGQPQIALEQARQAEKDAEAQAKADKMKARGLRWSASFALARAQSALGQKDIAIKSYYRALAHIEAIWITVAMATDVGAVAFGEERQAPYRELADLLIEQKLISEAYHIAEQSKSRTTLGQIEVRRRSGPPKPASQDATLRGLSRSIASQRTRLFSQRLSPKERANIEWKLEESEFALEEANANAEMERYRDRLGWVQPISVAEVQKKISQDNRNVLEFFLGEKRSFVWLISHDNISIEILPGQKEIEKEVKAYLALITTKPNNLYFERQSAIQKNLAEKLCSTLFGGLSERIAQSKNLMIVPDGILYYLPFEALIYKGSYLLENHEINYLPSASMLNISQNPDSRSEIGHKMELLAFGDPVFGPEPKSSETRGIYKNRQGLRSADGFRLFAIPQTRDEVEGISGLFAADRSHLYLGKGSREEVIKTEPLRDYKRLHLATHSLIDEKRPARSAVVLTLDANPDEDGFLEAGEIAELDLDCDLVVLSACQTGRGQLLSGEGVVGLSRAFFYAGARSVVVSLWNVSDISTSKLMKSFYKNLLSSVGNTAALREAKLQMMRSKNETRHPFYWAPFIIIGKP